MTETVILKHVTKGGTIITDVTPYVVGSSNIEFFFGQTKRVPRGAVVFDDTVMTDIGIEGLDGCQIFVDDGTENHVFSGLFIPDVSSDDKTYFQIRGYEHLTEVRRASGVHTGKTGTQIFRDLVTEYLPELSFDLTTIPNVADEENLEEQRYNAKLLKDIFDFIAERSNRVWRIDKNKQIYLVSPSFTSSGLTIDSSIIHGRPKIKKNTDLWQTLVRVEGESVETQFQSVIVVSDTTQTDYELDIVPNAVDVRIVAPGETTADTSPLKGAYAGSRRVDDDGVQYLVYPAERKISFTDDAPARSINDAVYLTFTLVDQVVSEQINPLAYAKYGLLTGAPEVNRLVTNQEQADELAQSLADVRGEPLIGIDGAEIDWDIRALPGNNVQFTYIHEGGLIDDDMNVVGMRIQFGSDEPQFFVTLNNIDYRAEDKLAKINARLRQLEEKETRNSTFVKKTIPWFANFGIEIYRTRVQESLIGNAFTFDYNDVSGMFDNSSRYIDGVNGSGSLTDNGYLEIANVDDKIKIFFNDDEEWDESSSTGSMDSSANTVTF